MAEAVCSRTGLFVFTHNVETHVRFDGSKFGCTGVEVRSGRLLLAVMQLWLHV